MRVRVEYNDGSEPEELVVTDGSVHFHPYPEGDTEKHDVNVEVLEADEGDEPSPEAYDPGAHTVGEVEDYVSSHLEEAKAVLDAEVAGKNRSTLVSWLQATIPFDPYDHTVGEVEDYVTAHPEELERIYTEESEGKARTTLLSWLEGQGAT